MDKVTFKKDPHGDGYLIRTAGWGPRFAKISLGPTRCGEIMDGIALDLCDCERPNKCQWHLSGMLAKMHEEVDALWRGEFPLPRYSSVSRHTLFFARSGHASSRTQQHFDDPSRLPSWNRTRESAGL